MVPTSPSTGTGTGAATAKRSCHGRSQSLSRSRSPRRPIRPLRRRRPPSRSTATATSAEEDTDPDSRAARRATRAATVRRRRRILFGVGVALVVLVLAFVLWYELESHAFGPPGPQVVVTVHQGESTDAVVNALSQHGVIGSALAFQISEIVHGTPTSCPASYALHQNQPFSDVRQLLAAGPNIYPVDVRPWLHPVRGGRKRWTASRPCDRELREGGGERRRALESRRAGPNNLEGMLGDGEYLVLPGESDTTILTDMVQRFDHEVQAAGITTASAGALGVTPYQMLTVASIVEKEGYIPVNMPDTARVIYNRLAQGTPLQMDSTVLYALGQDGGPVTSPGPQDPVPLQLLPEHRVDAHADLHALGGRAQRRRAPARRRVALLRAGEEGRHHGLLRHLRPAAGQRAAGQEPWPPLSPARRVIVP